MKTITYSRIGSLEIKLDLYLPDTKERGSLPALVFFHGGGTTCGSRKDLLAPERMKDSALSKSIIFISADYRLIHPSTAFDIISDIKTLFTFITSPKFSHEHLPEGITLNASRIAVSGASGGGYPAYAAGLYAEPKPKAVCVHFGQGGQLLDDQWLAVKDHPMPFPGAEMVTDEMMAPFFDKPLEPVSDSPIILSPEFMSVAKDNRHGLFMTFWMQGNYLDYLLGEPISAFLRALPLSERAQAIPEKLRRAVVQTQFDRDYPPTILVHGNIDPVIELAESQTTYDRLKDLGVKVELIVVEGAGHGLLDSLNPPNYAPGAFEAEEKGMVFIAEELFRD